MVNFTEVQRSAVLPGSRKLPVNHTRLPCSSSSATVRREGRSFRAIYADEQEMTAWAGRSRLTSSGVTALASPWWGTLKMSQGVARSSQTAP